jgi:hypothetical protein
MTAAGGGANVSCDFREGALGGTEGLLSWEGHIVGLDGRRVHAVGDVGLEGVIVGVRIRGSFDVAWRRWRQEVIWLNRVVLVVHPE